MPDTRDSIPTLGTLKGVSYFAKTSDGQWHYMNHAWTWQTCPPPVALKSPAKLSAPLVAVAEIRVPPGVIPFMDRHAQRAADALNGYLDACPNVGEKLGALGVLAQVLLAYGDSLQAMELQKTTAGNG